MKKEQKIIYLTMFLNLIIASTKLISGIMFNFSTLIADSLQTYADFITDIIASIASKIGKKRANKRYPFGYGMANNIANLFIGIILLSLAIYIFISSFNTHDLNLTNTIFIILITCIILKLITKLMLYYNSKKLNSNTLMSAVKESSLDLVASIIVLIVSILWLHKDKYPLLGYANIVGAIIISLIVSYMAIKIIIENIRYLMGINEYNEEIITKINEIINNNKLIKDSSIKLMKIGNYYNLYLTIKLETNVTLKKLFSLENRLKKEIKSLKLKIKFIEIEPKEYD